MPIRVNDDGTLPTWRDPDDGDRPKLADDVQSALSAVGGEHPDLAAHLALGLAAEHAHDYATSAHVHAGGGDHPDLATHEALGLAATHAHPYSATAHDHAGTYAGSVHSHVDGDLPAGLARDVEVTAAIATHAATPHGGEGGAGVPAGVIVMWGGLVANIPAGWLLCDGQNGTPDLTDRFVKSGTPGQTGGAVTHSHAAHTGVIDHAHPVTDPGHAHVENSNNATTGPLRGWGAPDTSTNTPTATGYSTASAQSGVTVDAPAGAVASLAHDSPSHEPPFYTLAFIQKV